MRNSLLRDKVGVARSDLLPKLAKPHVQRRDVRYTFDTSALHSRTSQSLVRDLGNTKDGQMIAVYEHFSNEE
jgi:hypothetical protein